MRVVIALVLLGGCVGTGSSGGGSRPVVMAPRFDSPTDAPNLDAVPDSSNIVVAGPEHRPGMTAREFQVETAAATAAAILGSLFSSKPR